MSPGGPSSECATVWRTIIRLAHDYPGIDDNAIWSVIQDDIPVLVPALRDLLAAAGEGA